MSILEAAIGLLAPPQCINCGDEGEAVCKNCTVSLIAPFGERCWRCNSLSPGSRTCASCRPTGSPAHAWIATNHDNLARDLLSLYKFGHQRAAAAPIVQLMANTFTYHCQNPKGYLVVPTPTASSHVRQRGFGHCELLAKKLSSKLELPYSNVLRRLDQTRQLGSRRDDRLKQLSESFAVKNNPMVAGQKILLVDDVVTTGGTLIAAAKTLRSAGARQVDALLFAKRL